MATTVIIVSSNESDSYIVEFWTYPYKQNKNTQNEWQHNAPWAWRYLFIKYFELLR